METAEFIAIAVVVVIAAAEVVCLFICSRHKGRSYPLYTVIPVFAKDNELSERLDYLSSIIEDGSLIADAVLLINYDASAEQLKLCTDFCQHYHISELIYPEDIETALGKQYKRRA
ncbi:hypothetical protein [Ruminococcus flavefaciens]|uniref:hypothetical protein n=1 Tax=Ruminococcus flavefaciens TaxID=1265 RepID=UPI0026F178A7|nr:hypothetical protein [Ruminococcus flavefaciens]MDD7515461.1 hypothetical protein [Ruminococcus flavefaciens]MDY5692836.1 hypothetical protein [Ruminococcus flavefaciens]